MLSLNETSVFADEDSTLSRNGADKSARIDLGLAVLATLPMPPGGWPTAVIAEACGCCCEAIAKIERRALKKLRERVSRDPILAELVDSLCLAQPKTNTDALAVNGWSARGTSLAGRAPKVAGFRERASGGM